MKPGTTSFAFRFQLMDPAKAPSIFDLVRQTAGAGLSKLQICENARPLDLPVERWKEVATLGADLGVGLQLGTKTTDADTFLAYLERSAELDSRQIRLVLEDHLGVPAGREQALRFFDVIMPRLQSTATRVAVENYFGIACHDLAAWCSGYPAELVGFCVDTANSLRKFERLDEVLTLLSPRAFCWHVKDWKLRGTDTGFSVTGAPLGTGDLPLPRLVDHIFATNARPDVYLENWPAVSGDRETDIQTDRAMLQAAIEGWNHAVALRRAGP